MPLKCKKKVRFLPNPLRIINMNLYLNISSARKSMKKNLGQANHFLITILIGLDGVLKHDLECPEDFSTSWNPKDKKRSVERSREFALKSALAWAVDCLDSYFIACNKKPFLIDNRDFKKDLDGANRSVYEKHRIFSSFVQADSKILKVYYSMVFWAIQWRNNTTHCEAENKLDEDCRQILIESGEDINTIFCGLDINCCLEHFDRRKIPTFKEVTSMIHAIQLCVEDIDHYLLKELDLNRYAKEIIEVFFHENSQEKVLFKNLKECRKISKITTILRNHSFTDKPLSVVALMNGNKCLDSQIIKVISDSMIK